MLVVAIDYHPGTFHLSPWARSARESRELEWPPPPSVLPIAIVDAWLSSSMGDVDALGRVISVLATPPEYDVPITRIDHVDRTRRLERLPALDAFGVLSRAEETNATAYAIWPDVELDSTDHEFLGRLLCRVNRIRERPAKLALSSAPLAGEGRVSVSTKPAEGCPVVRRVGFAPGQDAAQLLKSVIRALRNDEVVAASDAAEFSYYFPPHFGALERDIVNRYKNRAELPPRVERFRLNVVADCARPCLTDAIAIAEATRAAAMRASSARELRSADPILSGKAPSGEAGAGHEHAFYLPVDADEDGLIDHLDVWFPSGSSADAQRALLSVQKIYDPRIKGTFTLEHCGEAPSEIGKRWCTRTPFVLERHVKRSRSGGPIRAQAPEDQIVASLTSHRPDLPRPRVSIHSGTALGSGVQFPASRFRRIRRSESHEMAAYHATLVFEGSVSGPIVLGRHAHFGLGRFRPTPLATEFPKV